MSLAVLYSRARLGIDAPLVTVEVHLANGLPSLSIVGLPETAVRESKDRVRSALVHSGFEFPPSRITINLAPADLPKGGGRYDLAIALGILAASGQIQRESLEQFEFVAELALGGDLRSVRGVLPCALAARRQQRKIICAAEDAAEAALAGRDRVFPATHLLEVCSHLNGSEKLAHPEPPSLPQQCHSADLNEVRGQQQARRALEVAAAGMHNLIFVGPPGTGKTLLAQRLAGILPELSDDEALESATVASVSRQGFRLENWRRRAFRNPHHSASAAALTGGGSVPGPGEVSLAHHGVLFLDELPEFKRSALEGLREPLESGSITISRAARQSEFPARFQLVTAMNPCPCGYWGDPQHNCRCSAEQIQRYQSRISGPLLDRIDLQVQVSRTPWEQMRDDRPESSAVVLERVRQARSIQQSRGLLNAHIPLRSLDTLCVLDDAGQQILERVIQRFCLSPRSIHRLLKVARTIADLGHQQTIQPAHLQEAVSYRCLDRQQPHL